MDRKEVKFFINQILVNGRSAAISDFDPIKNEDLRTYSMAVNGEEKQIISIIKAFKENREERFVLFYTEEGDRYPYPKKVIDSDLKEIDNPRSADEIELTSQFFAVIDTATSRIFISDLRKKPTFIAWLKTITEKDITIKPLMVEEQFIEKIESLDQISFTVEPNLFNLDSGTLSSTLARDIYGFEAEEAVVKLIYKKRKVSAKIIDLLKEAFNAKSAYKNITVIGRTTDKFESMFNMNEVVSKISLRASLEESTQKIESSLLFIQIINRIKQDEN
jgi:hypothetical protein